MTDQKQIIDTSPEAASIKTVTGWVSSNGQYWGDDERMARWVGATHHVCTENPDHGLVEQRSYCKKCHAEKKDQQWLSMLKVPLSGDDFPLCIYDSDRYFFDEDDLTYWLEEHDVKPDQVRLVKCKPNYPESVEPEDLYIDILPEDGDVPDDVAEAFRALNEALKKCNPISWSPADVGVLLPANFLEAA